MTDASWIGPYAAIVATAALFLAARPWFGSGVRLHLSGMSGAAANPGARDSDHVVITVSNRGDTATTLTSLGFVFYPSLWAQLRRKPARRFVVVNPAPAQPLPFVLEPGGRWRGIGIHDEAVAQMLGQGRLWAQVHATHGGRPARLRLVLPGPAQARALAGAGTAGAG